MPLDEVEEEDGVGCGQRSSQSTEVQAELALTRQWIRMSFFHGACEVFPVFLLLVMDIPQLLGAPHDWLLSMEGVIALYTILHVNEVAKASFSTVFFFADDIKRISPRGFF